MIWFNNYTVDGIDITDWVLLKLFCLFIHGTDTASVAFNIANLSTNYEQVEDHFCGQKHQKITSFMGNTFLIFNSFKFALF